MTSPTSIWRSIRKAFIRKAFIRKAVPLTEVTLTYPGGWDAIFTGTPLVDTPINTLTLEDALPYLLDKGVTLDQIDIALLDTLPFPSWLLSDNPLAHVPLTPQLRTGTDQDRLNAWCDALRTATQDPCLSLAIDPNASPASPVTLFDVSIAGFSIESAPLEDILVRDVAAKPRSGSRAMPLSTFQIRSTTLGSIPVSALPAGYVDCTKVTCSTANFGQAAQAGAISTTKTLLDLFTDAGAAAIPQIAAFNLADLYQGLFPPEDLPWDLLDLDNVYLQNAASPAQPKLTYTMTFTVKGDRPAAVNVDFQLPPGFDTVRPGSLKIDGAPLPDPTIDANNLAKLPLGTLTPGVHTATLDTYAGLVLGPATATATGTATAGSDSATAQASKIVTVVEALENGATDPQGDYGDTDTVTIQPDNPTLYLAHLSTASDRDLYKFDIPDNGSTTGASIILGNLAADYDMVLYGPPPVLSKNPPQQRLLPVNDDGIDTSPSDETLSPDTVQDVPLAPPAYAPGIVAVAANRGLSNEEIRLPALAPGHYAIQISGYNGAHSPKPFSLRMTTTSTVNPECAAPPQRNSGATGPLTGPVTLGSNPHVLFVVPQQRLFATYGAGRAQPVIDRLQALATDVGGTILPVDNAGSAVAQKYADWDAHRCSVAAANDVVREIGKSIDAARAANANIDAVVLIGDDSLLPMARVPDRTAIGNEGTYGSEVMTNVVGPNGITSKSNELAAALLNGYSLTDDAYGTTAGIAVNEHELFVPDVALGRLVETPEDIVASMDTFLDPANHGTLDAASANSALVTGYDFMTDGAQQVASEPRGDGQDRRRLAHRRYLVGAGCPRQAVRRRGPRYQQPQYPFRPVAPSPGTGARRAEPPRPARRVGAHRPRASRRPGAAVAVHDGVSRGALRLRHLAREHDRLGPGGHRRGPGRSVRRQHRVRPRRRPAGRAHRAADGPVRARARRHRQRRPRADDRQAEVPRLDAGADAVRREGAAAGRLLRPADVRARRRHPRDQSERAAAVGDGADRGRPRREQPDDQRHRPAYEPAGRTAQPQPRGDAAHHPAGLLLRRERPDHHRAVPADRAGHDGRRHPARCRRLDAARPRRADHGAHVGRPRRIHAPVLPADARPRGRPNRH